MKSQIENRATFIARLEGKFSKDEIDEIMFAYDVSKETHRTHKRDSGERYFEHPRAGVLIILDEIGWYDKNAIIAFLLHDTGEDSPLFGNRERNYDEFIRSATLRLTKMFNSEVSELVILLTKPAVENVRFTTKEGAFTFYIEQLSKNPKALLLKMVDRLHNLRSLTGVTSEKRERTLLETEKVYIPLFHDIPREYSVYREKLVSSFSEAMGKSASAKVPNVGDKIYIPTMLYISHGADDFEGGLATVTRVKAQVNVGELVHFISTKEGGSHAETRWEEYLDKMQSELKKEFGNQIAHPDPDYREEFNRWD